MKNFKLLFAGFIGVCGLLISDSGNAAATRSSQRVGIVNTASTGATRGLSIGRVKTSTVTSTSSSSSSDLLDLGACSKKYMKCLQKSDVCGSDFSKCHSKLTFDAQKTYCADVLSSCTSAAKTSSSLIPTFNSSTGEVTGTGLIDLAIKNGLTASAEGAVEECLDEIDTCVSNACSSYPQLCDLSARVFTYKKGENKGSVVISDSLSSENINSADTSSLNAVKALAPNIGKALSTNSSISTGSESTGNLISAKLADLKPTKNSSQLRNDFLKTQCERTIGTNESCKIIAGKDPLTSGRTTRDMDDDEMSDVYDTVLGNYSAQVNSLASNIAKNFRDSMASKCYTDMETCVQNSCMGGSLAACYSNASGSDKIDLLSNNVTSSITNGCESVINSSVSCNYAYNNEAGNSDNLFNYLWTNNKTGYVTKLNGLLASSFSEGQIRELKMSCQNAIESCIDGVCGPDYSGCFVSNVENLKRGTKETGYTASSIKGYLDVEIVKGMCLPEVKQNQDCLDTYFANVVTDGNSHTSGGTGWGSPTKGIGTAWKSSTNNDENTIFNELLSDYETVILATMKSDMLKLREACLSGGDGYAWGAKPSTNSSRAPTASGSAVSDYMKKTPPSADSSNVLDNTCWVRVDVISDDDKLTRDSNLNLASKTSKRILSASFDSRWFPAGAAITCGEWNATEIRHRTLKANQTAIGWATAASVVGGAALGTGLAEGLKEKMGIKGADDISEEYGTLLSEFNTGGGKECTKSTTTTTTTNNSNCSNCQEGDKYKTLASGGVSSATTPKGTKIYEKCFNGLTPGRAMILFNKLKDKDGEVAENQDTSKGSKLVKNNTAKRVLADVGLAGAGATVLGLVVNKSMSAAAVKKGYENVNCYIGGTPVSTYGETFQLDKQE